MVARDHSWQPRAIGNSSGMFTTSLDICIARLHQRSGDLSPIGLSICFRGMENTKSRPRYMAKMLGLIWRGMFPSSTARFEKPSSCEILLPASCIFMSGEKLCLMAFGANNRVVIYEELTRA